MNEYNLLEEYPKLENPRVVNENDRNIHHRIIASKRDKDFFDGHRSYGYGGFNYDGRWKKIITNIIKRYKLTNSSKILQINSEKGFFLKDFSILLPGAEIYGCETSEYAYQNTLEEVKEKVIKVDNYLNINFPDSYFDFIICIGSVYTYNISDVIKVLKEIVRLSKGKSFINLASYTSKESYWLMKKWSLLGTTILEKKEWEEVLNYVSYEGDYAFTNSESLNIKKG
jgi:hypothetical protein